MLTTADLFRANEGKPFPEKPVGPYVLIFNGGYGTYMKFNGKPPSNLPPIVWWLKVELPIPPVTQEGK